MESIWELQEELGLSVQMMINSRTSSEEQTYFAQFMETHYSITYLLGLEEEILETSYDKTLTPGNDDAIMNLIDELEDAVLEEDLNQEWLEANSDELEDSMQFLMTDQEYIEYDLASTKAMLQEQLDSQKSYIESMKLAQSEEVPAVTVTVEEGEFDQEYVDFLSSMFTVLITLGLIFSIVTGGVCAYCCNRKFCRSKAGEGSEDPRREAKTIDMQVVTVNSPPSSPQLRLPGRNDAPKFGLNIKPMDRE